MAAHNGARVPDHTPAWHATTLAFAVDIDKPVRSGLRGPAPTSLATSLDWPLVSSRGAASPLGSGPSWLTSCARPAVAHGERPGACGYDPAETTFDIAASL